MKRVVLAAIAVLALAHPVLAGGGLNEKTELQLMKRACSMAAQGYTGNEIFDEVTYLVSVNDPSDIPKFTDPRAPNTFMSDITSGLDKIMQQSEMVKNQSIANSLIDKAVLKKCKF